MTITRREFLAGAAAAGYALAVRPVSSDTIGTDAQGLEAGLVEIPAAQRRLPAYRARPVAGERLPVLLVVHEIFGLHEHIRDVCRRLAKAGFLAVAPDLYLRQGDVTVLPDVSSVLEVVRRVPDAQVLADLDATLTWAEGEAGNRAPAGVTGFCWGGRMVWLQCAASARVAAGVAWYGRLEGETRPETPRQPLDVAGALRAPVLGLYGGEDPGIPPASVERMRERLRAAGDASEIVVYPGAPHGFHADYRASYRAEAARDGWARMLAWFERHGVAPQGRRSSTTAS